MAKKKTKACVGCSEAVESMFSLCDLCYDSVADAYDLGGDIDFSIHKMKSATKPDQFKRELGNALSVLKPYAKLLRGLGKKYGVK